MFISKKAVIAGVSTLVLVGGAVALAAFTTRGTGSEQITSAALDETAVSLTANLTGVVLYPGVEADVDIVATNNDEDVPLTVTDIDGVPDAEILVEGAPDCPALSFGASTSDPLPDVVIMPGDSEVVGTLTVDMIPNADNRCQGATLTIDMSADFESVVTDAGL